MVKIYTSTNSLEDNGAFNMVQMLYKASKEKWSGEYNTKTGKYDPYPYEFFRLDFQSKETFYDEEGYYTGDLELYYNEKTLKKWQEDQYVQFPAIHIKKISFYPGNFNDQYYSEECTCIEIESDNDIAVKDLFTFLSAFGDGGHSFGGVIKINNFKDSHIGSFGYDGDGCDRIYNIEIIN